MGTTRRRLLALGSGLAATGLAGCSTAAILGPPVTVSAVNATADSHSLTVHVFRTDRTERSDALVYRDTFHLAPADAGNDANRVTHHGVLDARRYDVRFRLDDVNGLQETARYYPDCLAESDVESGFQLQIEGRMGSDQPALSFQQSQCSSDTLWY